MNKKRLAVLLSLALGLAWPAVAAGAGHAETVWTTAQRLMPQWGFYRNVYGGPLGEGTAWTTGRHPLTWVAPVPEAGTWHLWVRRVHGRVAATVNESPLAGGRGGAADGNNLVWRHKGSVRLEAGAHHIDLLVTGQSMVDALLITSSETFDPRTDPLPGPLENPAGRGFRAYRDDSRLRPAAGDRNLVLGRLPLYEEVFYDWLPEPGEVLGDGKPVRLWGAAGQYINGTFGIRALDDIDGLEISLPEMRGPGDSVIGRGEIDLRVIVVREITMGMFGWGARGRARQPAADYMLRDNRTGTPPAGDQGGYGGGACVLSIPAGESRQVWLTVHLPEGRPAGFYSGDAEFRIGETTWAVPVVLEALELDLRPVDGWYSIFHRSQPVNPEGRFYVTEEQYRAEMRDMARHGLNAITLYAFRPEQLEWAREAGLARAPVHIQGPGGNAPALVRRAREMGFENLIFWGIDEPSHRHVERALALAERREQLGLGKNMMVTMTTKSREFYEETRHVISHPVFFNYTYDSNHPFVTEARAAGKEPVSYWMTSFPWPLWFRTLSGLYNTASGYQGTMPWAYTDTPEPAVKYDPDRMIHQVNYPDESGRPITTLRWEAFRAGIDDVRYLQALARALEQGRERLAEPEAPEGLAGAVEAAGEVYRRRFESIGGGQIRYHIRVRMDELEETRREFAEATVGIERSLRSGADD